VRGSTVVWPCDRRKRRIGRAAALELAKEGAMSRSVNGARPPPSCREEYRRQGSRGLAIPADVTDREACRTLVDEVAETRPA